MTQTTKATGAEIAWNDAQKRISALKKDFADMIAPPLHELPESIFVEHFLSWFAGEIKDESGDLRRQWIAVAKDEFSEVQIINQKREGIIVIPPLCNRNIFKISTGSGKRAIGSIVSKAFFHSELSVNAVGKDLNDELTGMVKGDENADAQMFTKRWEEVMQHFGKTLKPAIKAADSDGGEGSGLSVSYED